MSNLATLSITANGRRATRRLRRRDARTTHAKHFGPNMTPMVDVVLVLLVFFMAGASFLVRTWQTPIDLVPAPTAPRQSALPSLPEARVEIRVRERDGVPVIDAFGRSGLGRDAFNTAIRGGFADFGAGDVRLIVRPDASASYGLAVWVYDRCRLAGFERVELDASP